MLRTLLVVTAFFLAQFLIVWWSSVAGKLPSQGKILGLAYENLWTGALLLQFQFVPVFIFINYCVVVGFNYGHQVLPFVPLFLLWLASAPLTTFVFNALVTKEPVHWTVVAGVFLVVVGAFLVGAGKEVFG